MDFVNPLEIRGDGLELHPEPAVAGDGEAVLAHHGDQGAPVVLEDLHGATHGSNESIDDDDDNSIQRHDSGKTRPERSTLAYLPTSEISQGRIDPRSEGRRSARTEISGENEGQARVSVQSKAKVKESTESFGLGVTPGNCVWAGLVVLGPGLGIGPDSSFLGLSALNRKL